MFMKSIFTLHKSHLSYLWKTSVDSKILLAATEKINATPNIEAFRYRARKGTREKELAAKRARKLKEASKPKPIPKYLQRKVKQSPELQRVRCRDENWLETQPIDDVYNMKLYRGKPYAVAEAVTIFQDLHMPALLNDPSALIYLTVELELKRKEKNKFMDDFTGIVIYPHEFESAKKNKVIAICKEEEDQMKATEAGAVYAGSKPLIKQILSGTVRIDEDFDYIICHPDMFQEMKSIQGILLKKKKLPSVGNGMLRLDIDYGVASFIKGIEYSLKRSAIEPDFGWVDVCIGRINMPFAHIEENLKHALNTIENHKPKGTSHILFAIRALLWCEKTRMILKIPHWEYLPNYPENGILVKEDEESEI